MGSYGSHVPFQGRPPSSGREGDDAGEARAAHDEVGRDSCAFEYWTSCGFTGGEAIDLVLDRVSPSEHRELVRRSGCTAVQGVRILR